MIESAGSSIGRLTVVAAGLLLVPLVAMQLTDEVRWTLGDFVVAGALMIGAGAAYVLIAERSPSPGHRVAAGIAIGALLMLIWAGLAV